MSTESSKSTVLLIDDHPTICSGLQFLINSTETMQVVDTANDGATGIELAKQHEPDLILLDLNMPVMNGLETLEELRKQNISSRVVIFTVSDYKGDLTTLIKAGADGYLLKDMEPEDLLANIEKACNGNMVLSPELAPLLLESMHPKSNDRSIENLTRRELETVRLLSKGMTNKMIAKELDISEGTVKVHVKSLLKKLNLRSRVEVAIWVKEEKVFK